MTPPIRFKRLHPDAILPNRATPGSAGLDLYALYTNRGYHHHLSKHEMGGVLVHTGVAVEIPEGWQGEIRPRSSGFDVRVGTIDSDYRGELLVHVMQGFFCLSGDRIAQLVITPCHTGQPEWADELTETERGAGGFGSTGK